MGPHDNVRQPHWLGTRRRVTAPNHCVYVDTETFPAEHPHDKALRVHVLRLWVACAVRCEPNRKESAVWNRDTVKDTFWDWLDLWAAHRSKVWLFAHRISYDLTALGFWRQLQAGRYQVRGELPGDLADAGPDEAAVWRGKFIDRDPPTVIEFRTPEGCVVTACDTLNYFRAPLDQVGRAVGLDKLPLPRPADDDATWYARCKRDVEILREAMGQLFRWWRETAGGPWRPTAAGLAFSSFRTRMVPRSIHVHGHHAALKLEREAYYGGELRCWYVGPVLDPTAQWARVGDRRRTPDPEPPRGPVTVLDCTSLYPSVMAGNRYPVGLEAWIPNPKPGVLDRLADRWCYVAEVTVESGASELPVRRDGRTVYARGTLRTALAGPELDRLNREGRVLAVHQLAVYRPGDPFSAWVGEWWDRRRRALDEGNALWSDFAKLMLNSLYGKFGQRGERWEPVWDVPPQRDWGSWYQGSDRWDVPQEYRALNYRVYRHVMEGESAESCPAVAAYVTSYARERMRGLRALCPPRSVLYQDTDSLHVLPGGLTALEDAGMVAPRALGRLKVERAGESAWYYGLKHYQVGDTLVYGASRRTTGPHRAGRLTVTRVRRLRWLLRTYPGEMPVSKDVVIRPGDKHPDGTVGPDGWVTPYTADDRAAAAGPPGLGYFAEALSRDSCTPASTCS